MFNHTPSIKSDVGNLFEDARALFVATKDVAETKVVEARNRLSAVLENGEGSYRIARDKAMEGVKSADVAMHEHPYQSVGIAFGAGACLGFLLACRK